MLQSLTASEIRAFLADTSAPNASHSDAARCATWLCRGAGCALRWTRPSRSHDGRSCDVCRRSQAESDAIRDRAPLYAPLHRRFRLLSA